MKEAVPLGAPSDTLPVRDQTGPGGPYRLPSGLRLWLAAKGVSLALLAAREPGLSLATYLAVDPWLFWTIAVPRARGFGPVASTFRTPRQEVWVTIDDGPDPATTPAVLTLLDQHRARATFFLIGREAEKHPDLVREILLRGHTVENHTWSHPCWSFWCSGPKRLLSEIDRCNAALVAAGAPPPRYFRMPVGFKTPFLHPAAARRGLGVVAWSARGFDCTSAAAAASRRIFRGLRPGAIVLLHQGQAEPRRVEVVGRVLDGLAARGLRPVIPPPEALVW